MEARLEVGPVHWILCVMKEFLSSLPQRVNVIALYVFQCRFFTSAVATYRNKSSVLEYTAGGALAGAMYKFPMGPKAMVPGFLVGGGLGTIAGTVTYGAMMLSGTTAEEIRYLRKGWKETAAR